MIDIVWLSPADWQGLPVQSCDDMNTVQNGQGSREKGYRAEWICKCGKAETRNVDVAVVCLCVCGAFGCMMHMPPFGLGLTG